MRGVRDDRTAEDGSVDDEDRRAYLREHFRAASHAIDAGCAAGGILVWSLMDNFEWPSVTSGGSGSSMWITGRSAARRRECAARYAQVIRQNAVADE